MGFLLTLIYISLALLSPADLIPSLSEYRVQLVLAIVALLFSMPGFLGGHFFRTPQVYLLAGLFGAVILSQSVGGHWIGGGPIALERFLPNAIVFFLILLNCRTLERLKVLAFVLTAIAAFYVVQGATAYFAHDVGSAFLYSNPSDSGTGIIRMRGLGILHDPNDLAQFLVMIIPFFWMLRQDGRTLRNILFVVAPTVFLIFGIYLTHSRGAIVALLVMFLLGLKDRVGLVASTAVVALALPAFLAMNFSGGRAISMEAGQDRMEFWGTGLQLFKSSPMFGIGYGNFVDQNFGHTAHNSFVLCLAELGIIGYSLWMGLLVFTVSGLNSIIASIRPRRLSEEGSATVGKVENRGTDEDEENGMEVGRWARTLRISLAGFLAAAWFLSRAYALTLYLVLGMAGALLSLTSEEEKSITRQPLSRLFGLTAMAEVAAIAFLYVWLRARSVL
jgi:O-antigen ligase